MCLAAGRAAGSFDTQKGMVNVRLLGYRCGFLGTTEDGTAAIGHKYLTFGTPKDTRNAMRLEDAELRMV